MIKLILFHSLFVLCSSFLIFGLYFFIGDNNSKYTAAMNSCGFGKYFRPDWLQRFATAQCFLVVYGLLGTIQSMSYIYFVATLTTIEKRFKIPSKTTGMQFY